MLTEGKVAMKYLANGEAMDSDDLPSELLKPGHHDDASVILTQCAIIIAACKEEIVPQAWMDAVIETVFKKKDRTECGNYQGL